MYLLVVAHYCYHGMAGATGYEGIGGFPTAFTDFANISFLEVFPCRLFFSCVLSVFWLLSLTSYAYGTQRFLIGQKAPVSRAIWHDPGEISHVVCRVAIPLTDALKNRRRITGFLLWLRTFEDLGASFLMMPAITAVVLGGANIIYNGSGSIMGSALAALLVGFLQQGLQMAGVPNQNFQRIVGALLIIVVVGRSLVCIVTKSLNGTHAVAMRIRHDFLLKYGEKWQDTALKENDRLTHCVLVWHLRA